jgi:predicted MFS family arabinose efflux permease
MPVFAVNVFHSGPEGLGLLLSAVGVGGIVGGVLAAWLTQYDRVGYVQTGAILFFSVSLAGFAYSPNLHVAVFFLALAGLAEMVHATLHVTTLQMCATPEMRGRIASLLPLFPAFISIGSLTSGAGADVIGPVMTVLFTALAAAIIAMAAWMRSPALRTVTLSGLVARSS